MARPKKKYEQKAVTTTLRFTSRASIKIGESFYTMEACEERIIPDLSDIDIKQERRLLWDAVNEEVDNQLIEVKQVYGQK